MRWNVFSIKLECCLTDTLSHCLIAHLDDVHVWRGGGRGGRGGGAEGGHSHRGADLSAAVAVEVLIQPRIVAEKVVVVVSLLVTGVLVHSSPGDEKESWSVGRQADWAGLARPGPGCSILLPDQSGLVGAVSPRPHALNVTKLENVYN